MVWGAGGHRLFTYRPGRRDSKATGAVPLHSKEMRLGLRFRIKVSGYF